MEKFSGKPDGETHYEKVMRNIPSQYCKYVEDITYIQGGKVYERILKRILEKALPSSKLEKPPMLFPIQRGKTRGGYLQPDLQINNNTFIEVTTWGDSNMIFSKIMQGYLLKQSYPNAKYYVVIADLGIDDGWTWNKDKEEFWEKWSKIGDVMAVDGWFGFKNIDELVDRVEKQFVGSQVEIEPFTPNSMQLKVK